jgi:uncharacterized protein YjiS (DUF1127 family)
MFLSFFRLIRAWSGYRAGLRQLSRLDDRELSDIGIGRSDIPRVAREGLMDDTQAAESRP